MIRTVAALVALLVIAMPANAASVKLKWTASGDDGVIGQAAQVDIRYSTSPITAANFGAATRVMPSPIPSAPGATDSVTVTGLAPLTLFYFAIKTGDEVPNWASVSNVISVTTLGDPDVLPPAPITDLRAVASP